MDADELPYVDTTPETFARFARWLGGHSPAERARILLTAALASLEQLDAHNTASTNAVLALRLARLRPLAAKACEDGQGFHPDELVALLRLARTGLLVEPTAAG
jgi:hypothetical protein